MRWAPDKGEQHLYNEQTIPKHKVMCKILLKDFVVSNGTTKDLPKCRKALDQEFERENG